ncbi:MAG TPA: sigma-70 family RNA polymerase sigma factor [Gemmatirosa sp.]|nr:sigma-70 family RNA polymerase sigma factor [Gemmatirosa sp.]
MVFRLAPARSGESRSQTAPAPQSSRSQPAVEPPQAMSLDLEPHRPALTGHCYRMLGSVLDAEDAVQETMLRAWKAAGRFDQRAAVRTWLYRIATNVCLDLLAGRQRRARPMDLSSSAWQPVEASLAARQPEATWIEPIPDAMALPAAEASDPAEHAILRESIRLAFVAALQYLPPRQRAALLLTQVLGWSAAEAAETLEISVASVNSALQRARATLAARNPAVAPRELSDEQRGLLARYVAAFEAYDVAALTALLHEEATMSMPPYELWLRGHESIARWFLGFGIGCRGSRFVPAGTACGGLPAFAHYKQGGAEAWALVVLEVEGERIGAMTFFLDVATLFPRFGLPMRLEGARAG